MAAGSAEGGAGRNGHRPRRPVRRPPLASSRAVVGGLLVAAAAVGLFSLSTRAQSGSGASYVVVRHAVAPGARLSEADLTRVELELPSELERHAFREIRTLVGATTVAPLAAGDLVQASAVVAKPSEAMHREVTFAVARPTLAATLEQGERVDVIATYGTGTDAYSTVVLRQALVVGLDRGRDRVGGEDDISVTVAVEDPNDVVALAHALQLAKLTVVRATGAAPVSGAATYRQPTTAGERS